MDVTSLQAIVGANCRRIRTEHNVTQAQLASHARRNGLRWTESKAGDLEAGRHAVSFATVLKVVLALDNAIAQGKPLSRTRPRVRLADLVQTDGHVDLGEGFEPPGEALVAVCSGRPWELPTSEADVDDLLTPAPGRLGEVYRMSVWAVDDMRRRSTVTETRLAARLDVEPDHLLAVSWKLWNRPFGEERDRRAGGAKGRRGQVARALTTELQAELWKEEHGND